VDVKNSAPIRELTLTRTFKAPRALVWQAWTDPKHVEQWWGPRGFSTTVKEWDVRPGRPMNYVMTAPDGMQFPCEGVCIEASPPERLVSKAILRDESGEPFLEILNTLTLTEKNGATTLHLHMAVVLATELAAMPLAGMEQGSNENLDRLGDYLTK
jgi:uncharacterized protein YndB with AHSA1/START domain